MATRTRACILAAVAGAVLLEAGTAGSRAEDEKVQEFQGKWVPLERPVAGQAPGRSHAHPLGDEIRAGGRTFAVRREGRSKPQVALKAGATPSTPVREDKPLTFTWSDERGSGEIHLRFFQAPGGGWHWFSAEALAVDFPAQGVRFYDLDADGRIEPGADGWSLAEAGLFLPLEGSLVAGPDVVALKGVDPEGRKVRAALERMPGNDLQLLATSRLNLMRAHSGLPPVVHDEERAKPATAHARYLQANQWKDDFNPYGQKAGAPGASDAWDRIVGKSLIQRTPHARVVEAWFCSWLNRGPLVDPTLGRIGVNEGPPEMTVLNFADAMEKPIPKEQAWENPVLVPAEGTRDFPTAFFAKGEDPPPVPTPEVRGPPLWALFWHRARDPQKFQAKLFELRENKRKGVEEVPVDVLPSEKGTGPGVARGVVPGTPLKPRTWYRVAYTFELEGKEQARSARFLTR